MALTTGLISYWKLDEASGNAIDSHGANTLTDFNTVGSATGKINNARDFEAANSEYLSASNSSLQTGDIEFTFTAWIKFESVDAGQVILSKDDFSVREYFILFDFATDRLNAAIFPGGTQVTVVSNSAGAVIAGVWYFIAFWHDPAANKIYLQVNNGGVDEIAASGGTVTGPAAFQIGALAGVIPFDGLIDEVGFWKRVLTPAERGQLYNGGAGLAYPFAPPVVSGTGALVAGTAAASGAGVSRSTGAGVLTAQAAALSGIGSAFSVTAGTGALVAQRAVVSGVGTSRSTGVGTLVAQAASLAGTGAAQGAGMGVLAAQSATLSGTGTIGLATVSGAGVLAAGAALVTGTGVILAVATGQGALAAGLAGLSATGTSETTGTGALAARAATVVGQFIVTTGVGALNARRATVAGTGTTTGDSSSVDFEGDLIDVIGPLVGGRAYPNTYPQDCIWPAIRYTLVSVDPADDLCSHAEEEDGVETSDVRVQFDLVAETYTQSRDLRVAMRKAMRGFDPPALMSAEFNTYDTETKVHRVVMDYVFYPSSD